MSTSSSATLLDRFVVRSAGFSTLLRALSVLFIAALTAAAAQISVPLPFTQVPFTFQPMIVLLGGLALGARLGAAAQVLYLLAGVAGLAVFAASPTLPPGALRLLGPTGGYLMSYPLAAFATGYLARRGFDKRYITSVLAMAVGLVIVYGCGAMWLGWFAQVPATAAPIGLRTAILTGIVPFVAADAIKLLLAAGTVPTIWKLVGSDPSHR
jgi:biotin transport system substrate-specific component